VERITLFLSRELRDGEIPDEGIAGSKRLVDASVPLLLEKAAFQLGDSFAGPSLDEPLNKSKKDGSVFRVLEFDVSVRKGEVLAVCGPVGCGKSTLINGIIDEVPASPESTVLTQGRVAYVAQSPFILNMTLRDNILFGLPFEKDVYDRVLDSCCLRQDVEQLGGDLIEIGERGVTLSGGKKSYGCSLLSLLFGKTLTLILL